MKLLLLIMLLLAACSEHNHPVPGDPVDPPQEPTPIVKTFKCVDKTGSTLYENEVTDVQDFGKYYLVTQADKKLVKVGKSIATCELK